jgi:ubiquinone biosynthesis protein
VAGQPAPADALALAAAQTLDLSRGARMRLALQDLGPIFIKFGQLLSTRRDLLPTDIADELMLLQDRVPPFDPQHAVALIEEQLGAKVGEVFSRFDVEPLASASVAQVHAAPEKRRRSGGQGGAPGPEAGDRPGPGLAVPDRQGRRARLPAPGRVVGDYEKTIYDELDLLREAANASQLRRNFEGSELMYVPQVYWDFCRPKVLVMERIYGVPVTDMATLADQRTDMKLLAERGVEMFFTQVFRDSFFHADMHRATSSSAPSSRGARSTSPSTAASSAA